MATCSSELCTVPTLKLDVPPETWGWYSYLMWETLQRQGHPVYNRRRFEESVAADGIRRLSGRAAELYATFELDGRALAACLVDGTAPRYAKRRA